MISDKVIENKIVAWNEICDTIEVYVPKIIDLLENFRNQKIVKVDDTMVSKLKKALERIQKEIHKDFNGVCYCTTGYGYFEVNFVRSYPTSQTCNYMRYLLSLGHIDCRILNDIYSPAYPERIREPVDVFSIRKKMLGIKESYDKEIRQLKELLPYELYDDMCL